MDPAQHYYHQPRQLTQDELEVEHQLSYGDLDRAVSVVASRYAPSPLPRPRPLSTIEEASEATHLRPNSVASGSSGRSSHETAGSQTALLSRAADKGYARVDGEDDYEYDYEDARGQYPESYYPQQPSSTYGSYSEPFYPGRPPSLYSALSSRQQGQGLPLYSAGASVHGSNASSRPQSASFTAREPSPLLDRNARVPNYTAPQRPASRSRSATPDGFDVAEKHDIEADPEKLPVASESSSSMSTLEYTPVIPQSRQHFGPAPKGRVKTRAKPEKTKVQLQNGTIDVGLPIPTKLVLPTAKSPSEMTKMKYTAIQCDPDMFVKKGFKLRQVHAKRTTELMVVITMYNEDEILFTRTLYGVMKNISHLCSRKASKTWGPGSWEKVVVCIIADGRRNVHPRVLDCLRVLGVFRDDAMQAAINGRAVHGHLFEYTTSFALDPDLHFKYPEKGIVPTQIILLIKENNGKKINSHRWCLNAFAPLLQPNVIVLLDVGTRPGHNSLYKLWKTFDMNSNVGGACGEIAVYKSRRWIGLLNPLVAAQNFEYKMSNILDKPTEALFGYISVLPGAFSAYRYLALKNDKHGNGPLASYFKGEFVHGRDSDIFTSNMYLAEDRILCFELVARPGASWVLRYVPGAVGETDVPDTLPEFILQRRRWLNGSFFAAIYALWHVGQVMRSGHTVGRKVLLAIEAAYNSINLVFAWFAVGNYFIFFTLLTSGIEDIPRLGGIKYFNNITQAIYASLLVSSFLFSMGNKPRGSLLKYQTAVWLFALMTLYMLVCAGLCAYRVIDAGGTLYGQMLVSLLATFGMYIASSVLAFDPWHLVTCFIQYLLLSPAYVNVLNIYAFANLDDISWGTKGEDRQPQVDLGSVVQDKEANVELGLDGEDAVNERYMEALDNLKNRRAIPIPERSQGDLDLAAKDYYANVRTNVLLFWVLSNGLLVLCILSGGGANKTFSSDSHGGETQRAYMVFILAFVAITSIIRFLASTLYGIMTLFTG